jgi:poly(3-hydroxybutyrate) depolymerase
MPEGPRQKESANMSFFRSPVVRLSSLLAACVLVGACATKEVDTSPDEDDASSGSGAGDSAPLRPEDVPAERLQADKSQCAPTYQGSAPVDGHNTGYDSGGQPRSFVMMLPDASFEGPRPPFFGFSGTTEDGTGFAERANLEEFRQRGFIVISPDQEQNGTIWPVWDSMRRANDNSPNLDVDFFDSLVACTAAHHQVDKNRVYVGGHSAGGIMANFMLQRRSELLAGAIVGSGVHSLTTVTDGPPMSDTFALITWGGDNDEWSGSTIGGGAAVPKFNFVEQASIASQFYAEQPNVGMANCRGPNWGHAWLDPINQWMIDELLRHPKGVSGKEGVDVTDPGEGVICSGAPYEFTGGLTVVCPMQSAVEGCGEFCQLMADCAVENATVSNVLEPQLGELGFSGVKNSDCGGCVARCEQTSSTAADDQVLSCIDQVASTRTCGPGIDGALPALDAINECCEGRGDSPLCIDTCTIMRGNSATDSFLPTCVALVPNP